MQDDKLEIPPAAIELYGEVKDVSDEEYDQSYASGSGGHTVPPEVLATLHGEGPK